MTIMDLGFQYHWPKLAIYIIVNKTYKYFLQSSTSTNWVITILFLQIIKLFRSH